MKTIVITEYVGLEPEFLSKNMLKPKILESIDEKFLGKCHSKYGFIIKIFKDTVIILENYISSIDNNVNFKVEFNAQIILPEVGQVIKCKVDMIFNHGIFASIHNLKLLVPKTQLSKYEFTTNVDNNPIYKSAKRKIEKDNEIECKINAVRYDKKQYSCIGELN